MGSTPPSSEHAVPKPSGLRNGVFACYGVLSWRVRWFGRVLGWFRGSWRRFRRCSAWLWRRLWVLVVLAAGSGRVWSDIKHKVLVASPEVPGFVATRQGPCGRGVGSDSAHASAVVAPCPVGRVGVSGVSVYSFSKGDPAGVQEHPLPEHMERVMVGGP